MSVISILAIASIISATAILILFAYQLQWMKKIRLSFPDIDESPLWVSLKKHLGSGKIEEKAAEWSAAMCAALIRIALRAKTHPFVSVVKNRADHLLGKKTAIPERESSSAFLKNISAYKKKMQEMHNEEDHKEEE